MGAVGRVLIGGGVLLLLFVAYQLWGTGIHAARAQSGLKSDLREVLESVSTTDRTEAPPEPVPGEAVALIEIPEIGVDWAVVEGVTVADLKKGPGHYPATPLPGQAGNAAIAAHRTTYGAPFNKLADLAAGDEIVVTTRQGEFTYLVETTQVVKPSQTEVLQPPDDPDAAVLTLTTCHPMFSARERLIVSARLAPDLEPAPAPERPAGAEPVAVSFEDEGLSGDRAAARPTVLWGLAAAAVALVVWLLGRRVARLFWFLGAPVFLVVLFVFYENVARLLPANI